MSDTADLTVAIISYRSLGVLKACLEDWAGATAGISARLVVVENGTGEDIVGAVRSRVADSRVDVLETSLTFTRAVNRALAGADSRYVAILNPDTRLMPESMTKLVRFLDARKDVGIVGPRVWDEAERRTTQRSWRRFPGLSTALFSRHSLLSRLWPSNPWTRAYLMGDASPDQVQVCDWVSGCCLLARAELFRACGGLDEGFPMYCEDVDLCRRAKLRGWEVAYCPDAEIAHFIGASSGQVPWRSHVYRHLSIQHYVLKWWKPWNPLAWILCAGVWARFAAGALKLGLQRLIRPKSAQRKPSSLA